MASANFHLFNKLPRECQLIIWTFYRDGRSGMRHCFSVDGDSLLYAALEKEDFSLVDNTTTGFGDLDLWSRARPSMPMEQVKLGRDVSILAHMACAAIIFKSTPDSWLTLPGELRNRPVSRHKSSEVWLNFAEDTFYFDRASDQTPVFRWQPSWFRPLYPGKSEIVPRPLSDQHWIFRVQKLALRITSSLRGWIRPWDPVCPPWDVQILQRMKDLRSLQLVVHVADSEAAAQWQSSLDYRKGFITESRFDSSSCLDGLGNAARLVASGLDQARLVKNEIRKMGVIAKIDVMVDLC
ncbi:hypothetical protein TruAng_010527 [Truncatella angustata]|nr:hypothetical protein TruAng_010527 [Truncatella angustata]